MLELICHDGSSKPCVWWKWKQVAVVVFSRTREMLTTKDREEKALSWPHASRPRLHLGKAVDC